MGMQGSSPCGACGEISHWKTRSKLGGNCPGCSAPFQKADTAPKVVAENNGPRPPSEDEKTLTTGRRGFKPCVCGKYSSIGRTICWACNSTFGAKSENVEVENTKRVPTPEELSLKVWKAGYRQCNECNRFTAGPRSSECVHCENVFPKKDRVKPLEIKENDEDRPERLIEVKRFPDQYVYPDNGMPIQRIYIPRGECPFKIPRSGMEAFPSDDAIKAWAHKVRQSLINQNEFPGNAALFYWAIQQVNGDGRYRYDSEEMKYLKLVIDSLPDVTVRKVPA
jgi:hypothetical protein